jgi:DNA polymerase I-like protein with 3'-5' exonuclease and polymerase domains
VRNEAINAPIQGTAADGLKIAMGRLYKGLKKFGGSAFIAGAFHDEILVECDEADAEDVQTITRSAMLETMDELLNASDPRVRIKMSGGVSPVWTKE